jgi:hypothetical protein
MEQTTFDNNFRPIESVDDITGEDTLKVKLRFPIKWQGADFDHITFRYPSVADMKYSSKSKDEQEKLERLIIKIAIEPPMSPESVENLSFVDLNLINIALAKSGFLALTSMDRT